MKRLLFKGLLLFLMINTGSIFAQKPPIMGWSSWNNFRIHIDEKMIREQADALLSSGMYDAGYRFINIDDGYFGGRNSEGELFENKEKFPSGMKALADYIHSKGLKAGIYSDAGEDTCGSIWDNDKLGIGVGLKKHLNQDLDLFFNRWGYDFIKVDWCGGEKLHLDEETQYTRIIQAVRAINSDIVFNVCRWQYPGSWVDHLADSWRISGDIRSDFKSILHIIDLAKKDEGHSSPGHYNDMDMLQVGRGMGYEEDKTHFSMWAFLNSPLLAGNDLRNMSAQTIEILTNSEIIALNQDPLMQQGKFKLAKGDIEIWERPLSKGRKAVAIMNRGKTQTITLSAEDLGLKSSDKIRDLWEHKNIGRYSSSRTFELPEHGIIVLQTK